MSDRKIMVVAVVDFEQENLSAIEGSATVDDQRFDFVLNQDVRQLAYVYGGPDGASANPVQYRYRAYIARNAGFSQRNCFESPALTTDAYTFVINPRNLYKRIIVRAAAVFHPEKYRNAFVDVKAEVAKSGWSHTETMRIDAQKFTEGEVHFIVDADASVTLQRRYRYVTGAGDIVELPWQPADEGTLVVGNPPAAGPGNG